MQNKKLYVLRKMSSYDDVNHLIAVLGKDESGEYHLRSMLDDSTAAQEYALPVLSKAVGENAQAAILKWLGGFLPPLDNKPVISALLDRFGMTEFDEWEWLKHYRPEDKNLVSFSETLPENCIRHDLAPEDFEEAEDECSEYDEYDYSSGLDENWFNACNINYVGDEYEEDFYEEDEEEPGCEDDAECFDEYCGNDEIQNAAQTASEHRKTSSIPLDDFIDREEMNIVTDGDAIDKTFETMLTFKLKEFFARIKDPASPITTISALYNVPYEDARERTVKDVLSWLPGQAYWSSPRPYPGKKVDFYIALSLQLSAMSQFIPILL